jgi:KUP system potassium uptake protein
MYPMVVMATLATVIASQALISGAFSLTSQAMQLGYLPRMRVVHTSESKEGQIFVPRVNTLLMVACVLLVLGFKQSTNLAAAYGIAVTGTMVITSLLFYLALKDRWGKLKAGSLTAAFLVVDLAFFAGNVPKIPHGGWLSVLAAAIVFTVMTTWRKGRLLLRQSVMSSTLPITLFLEDLRLHGAVRVRGAAVFMTLNPDTAPAALLHNFKHCKMLHDQVVLLTVQTDRVPEVSDAERLTVKDLGQGFYRAIARYGYMQRPDVPDLMARCRAMGIQLDPTPSFYLSREQLLATGRSGMHPLRTGLFSFLTRNAHSATDYFGIPPNAVVELGMVVEL